MHFLPHLLHWMQEIQAAGWMGYLLFIGLYALCCVFFIPASFLTLAAGAVYGFWIGLALVLAGNGLGSVFCLLLTRYAFRGWLPGWLKRNPKMGAISDAVRKDGWKIVFLTRLSPVMPFSLINYALGLTKISAWSFLLATVLGSVPAIAIYVYLGTLMGNLANISTDMHKRGATYWAVQGVALAVAAGVTIYVTRLASKALTKRMRKR